MTQFQKYQCAEEINATVPGCPTIYKRIRKKREPARLSPTGSFFSSSAFIGQSMFELVLSETLI